MEDDPRKPAALAELETIAQAVQAKFKEGRRLLSFQQYLELFAEDPVRHGRDASRYLRDVFEHYGTTVVKKPWGPVTRYRLFDLPFGDRGHRDDAALVGQEELAAELKRAVSNFAQEGRANRLVLMHGPNGSSKSTAVRCMLRALEHYSSLDEGALYRFHWVFPSRKTVRGAIGFAPGRASAADDLSYAHLEDEAIDARLMMELRDHPLFLIPQDQRAELLASLHRAAGSKESPCAWLLEGRLSHKNRQVFDALLTSHGGSLAEVLRHVQVERYFISRRYRVGAVTVGPELSVDASERQVTADRSLSALPTALQAVPLFEAYGELVDSAGGILEFSDLLKRPLDAFRYLQQTLETGEVRLTSQTVQTNCVMVGSANDIHLTAFREHPEFPSFRGRTDLIRVPYLRSYLDEQRIYDSQIVPLLECHVAPHATRVAAKFAVLSRLKQPETKQYSSDLASIISSLTVHEKLELYATGTAPERLDGDSQKLLRAGLGNVYREFDTREEYEGQLGASPRTMRTLLLDAAQSPDYAYLSPFAVLAELDELTTRTSEYEWLTLKPLSGGYHDAKGFVKALREDLLETLEHDMRTASGLVEEEQYEELFDRYIQQVTYWVKGEKVRNNVTGAYEDPDERTMREVEDRLGVDDKRDEHRRSLISAIAAWAIDHPGDKVINAEVFPSELKRLQEAVFQERRKPVAMLTRDLVTLLRSQLERSTEKTSERDLDLLEENKKRAQRALDRLRSMGYQAESALDTATALLQTRFAELFS